MNDKPYDPGPKGSSLSVLYGARAEHLLREELLCEIFADTTRRNPDAIALKSSNQSLTYRDLDARSDDIRRGLLAHGVGPGDIVGLWMQRGIDALIIQLAIAKTGAAWLPFDAEAPIERIAACIEDAETRLLLIHGILSQGVGTTRRESDRRVGNRHSGT